MGMVMITSVGKDNNEKVAGEGDPTQYINMTDQRTHQQPTGYPRPC